MRWQGRRESSNVEDRRRISGGPMIVGGGLGTILLLVVIVLLGGDPQALLEQLPQQAGPIQQQGNEPLDPEDEKLRQFVSVVLADTEDVWNEQFRRLGREYQEPTLVLFRGQVQSACGTASSAVGPFYCPLDQKVYLDLGFYEELSNRFGAPGDFAQAYVVAHEIGHHVQNLLGTSEKVQRMRGRVSDAEYNDLSVRLELQADFLAGVWAHHAQRTKNILERGDIEEGLQAAHAIGDDTLQKQAQGYAVPDSFTHGTSEQRVRWFRKGLETGDINQGDTFSARQL
ncbi:MAG: neutral zinc metallopeptidase [Pirellulales bacterium]|nr:neutral zinc metallopeptidase [Pirellulales bacterium]